MNFRFRRFLATTTLAVACAAAGSAWAGARDDLKTFTSGLKGLDGQFSQQVFDSRGKVKESTSGRVALSAPRLFRWEYVRPHEQLIVADGKKVWMYEPDLEQATVREQGKEEQNSPLTALINPALLEQQYDVSEEAAQRDGLQWLSLSPKRETEASFQYAALGFNAQGLAKMEITDAVGQRTVISFSGWKRNPGFAVGTFSFTPPKGTDVIGN
ncbi:outer membrane lipoprotein chaperone LolA [Stenotrophomonas maltophilia]|uniref:outer membrane lipoprotein chaperone LolA n=1 Tax=Stenotrophomonas maltophilia TaxID=40324 RepID=UPI0005B71D3D|nr:outer membrane lipoprotein chaperone LolA [Stenotrophomonas maltophilia]EKT4074371.1 outer membrane lipoprotein chaperone LolA [Stenotrophomonas maltophilia]EKT4083904.1 outer membrane lipoprotein chaperone LolA [Stenotrophomonas maltophilia]KIS40678.1 outer-membrane lipoprotein carrier protein [Stenotrophomonas maltophilia WJ66]KZC91519.1 outer membrane lipoprotein carrier protein LolA [Stenotrophomonas maltophilia]MBA0288418.1 outer membrane lipoprotein chaperone LolA [Stenotrophomonas ma